MMAAWYVPAICRCTPDRTRRIPSLHWYLTNPSFSLHPDTFRGLRTHWKMEMGARTGTCNRNREYNNTATYVPQHLPGYSELVLFNTLHVLTYPRLHLTVVPTDRPMPMRSFCAVILADEISGFLFEIDVAASFLVQRVASLELPTYVPANGRFLVEYRDDEQGDVS
ncbi:hypothetical protein EDC04DRAFT_2773986, partial [Pisolithus marmoratus]